MNDNTTIIAVLGLLVTSLGTTFAILATLRKNRRENEDDAQKRSEKLMKLIESQREDSARQAKDQRDEILTEVRADRITIGDRLKALEVKSEGFMPRNEIEAKIEHEKNNRQTADNALKNVADKTVADVGDIKVSIGRLSERHDSMAADMGEIKALLKENQRDTKAEFERLRETVVASHSPRAA